jgi:hypothetical protein
MQQPNQQNQQNQQNQPNQVNHEKEENIKLEIKSELTQTILDENYYEHKRYLLYENYLQTIHKHSVIFYNKYINYKNKLQLKYPMFNDEYIIEHKKLLKRYMRVYNIYRSKVSNVYDKMLYDINIEELKTLSHELFKNPIDKNESEKEVITWVELTNTDTW